MIEKMHERTNGPVFKVIFALVSLSFVLGGISGGFLGADTSAVKVNGQEISQQAFNRAKSYQQNQLNAQLGERFWDMLDNPDYAQQFNRNILNRLIDDELLRQYAQTLKLGISAEQIKSEIVNNPDFQQDGKFNNAFYQQALRQNGLSADQYASLVAEGMLFAQLQQGLVDSQFSLPVQQALLAKLLLQKRTVRLATYSVAKEMENQTVSAEEAQAYYQSNQAKFINPEKIAVEYVLFSSKEVADQLQITPEQIETYYQANLAQFVSKGEAEVAHIQVADEAAAQAIAQALSNGADFATLAKEKSQDPLSAAQGGNLGWVKAGIFPAAFEQAVAGLAVGQVSPPVKVDGAYHIIKVLQRQGEKTISLDDAKANIAQILRNELAPAEYSSITREMANKAFENNGSLDPVAQLAKGKVVKTALFSRDNIPAALNHDKVLKVLFESEIKQNGQNSEPIDLSNGTQLETLFVRVSDYQAESTKTFEQAKAEVEQAVKFDKAEKALQAKAEQQLNALNAGQTSDITFAPAETLTYSQAQLEQPMLAETVFAMPKPSDKAQYQIAKNPAGDVIIVALDKVVDGNPADAQPFAAQIAEGEKTVLRHDLLNALRERAKIELNDDFINEMNNSK